MRRRLAVIVVLIVAVFVYGQTRKPRPAVRQAAHPAPGAASGLPTKAAVDSFLEHVFGWDRNVSWTVTSIAPSAAPGIAQLTVDLKSPRKSGTQTLFILPDGRYAIHGQMFPFAGPPAPAKPSEAAIAGFVRQATAGNPGITSKTAEIKPDALAGLTRITVVLTTPQGGGGVADFYVTRDGGHALVGEVSPFGADPYAPVRAELARGINGPERGPAGAPVTIVEFADLECPACKMAAPIVHRLLTDLPNTRFVFQQFPLTQIHPWSFKAATFGDCVARENNPGFWKFLNDVYADQEQINAANAEQKLKQAAGQAGVDGAKTAACAALPSTAARINHSLELGKSLRITGTPTLFIGGRQISNVTGMPYDTLKQITEFMGTPAARPEAKKSEVRSKR